MKITYLAFSLCSASFEINSERNHVMSIDNKSPTTNDDHSGQINETNW